MTEKHVVADGDVPDNIRIVLAWWETALSYPWARWGIAYYNDWVWHVWNSNVWVDAEVPTYWYELPEVDG